LRGTINVTPLVDVVLVLLIVFMVVTPMLQRGKAVILPKAKEVSELQSGDPIVVAITGDGRLWIDRAEVGAVGLSGELAEAMARMPGVPVVLKADRELDYKVVRRTIREIARAGATGVSLAATEVHAEGAR
jgi:biopolymer transport protein ExbD/biopolymer transport protein TolR